MLKLVSVLFLSFGLVFISGSNAAEGKADCCSKKLACCKDGGSACCVATAKLGCCEKGKACCEKNLACCKAVQECCRLGEKCCDEGKACCGPTAKKPDLQVKSCCEAAKKTEVKATCAGGKCCAAK